MSVVAILVLLAIYIVIDRRNKSEVPTDISPTATTTGTNSVTSTTTTSSGQKIVTTSNGTYTIKEVSLNEGKTFPQPIPDLNRPVKVSTSVAVSPEAFAVASKKIPEIQALLKTNLGDWKNWIELGLYQKMAGDYLGAVISWKYALRLAPTDFVAPGDLADLYAYYLKDNVQAEYYYKIAIANGTSKTAYLYIQYATYYRDIIKDIAKARAIIDQGLIKIPNNPALLEFKASLQ